MNMNMMYYELVS